MINRLRDKMSDEFLRNNAVFFFGSLLVAALNYLYHPIIGRLLTVEQFGEVQGYLSIAIQLGVLSIVFGMVVMNIKAKAVESDNPKIIADLYSVGILVALVVTAGLLLLSPWLAEVFELPNQTAWFLVAFVFFIGMPRAFARFQLQAEKRFGLVSAFELLSAVGKIIFALLLFWLGFEVLGAVGGFVLAILVGLVLMYRYTSKTISIKNISWPRYTPELRHELRYGVLVLTAISFTMFLYSVDILLMRYFFSPEVAGQYAGIATVARIIIFATASVAGVLLAHVTRSKSVRENKQLLIKGLAIVGAIGGVGLAIFAALPQFTVSILMGPNFLPMAGLLPLLTFVMFLASLVNLMVMYCVALRFYSVIVIIFIATATIAFGAYMWHSDVFDVVNSFIVGLAVALFLLSWRISTHR